MIRRTLLALTLLLLPLHAADFAGAWKGGVMLKAANGSVVDEYEAFLDLKQDGERISGTAGRVGMDAATVKEGKAAGEVLTFRVQVSPDAPLVAVTLKLAADGVLAGAFPIELDGQTLTAVLRFERKK